MRLVAAGVALGLLGLAVACGPPARDRVLDLVSTTSTRDSGLLDELLPAFQEQTGIEVRLVAVGSGAALRMGAEGNADVLLTHAPEGEQALVEAGELVDRVPFMRNYFVIAGPSHDPAGVRGAADAADALRRIAQANAVFVSRADDSGTHRREQAVLAAAGLDPAASWGAVQRTNAGMGQTLQVAGELRAYVLSDVGTFRRFRERIDLVRLSDPDDPELANIYSVSRPASDGRDLNVAGARRLAAYLTSAETQRRIGAFGRDVDGEPLFIPLLLGERDG